MTKEEFMNELRSRRFDLSIICWEPSVRDDVFCLYKDNDKWIVYYQERGTIFYKSTFETESEAIEYLFKKLF